MEQVKVTKPCRILNYCPYGPLVEQFPLKKNSDGKSCNVFGHDCPVYTCAENEKDNICPAPEVLISEVELGLGIRIISRKDVKKGRKNAGKDA